MTDAGSRRRAIPTEIRALLMARVLLTIAVVGQVTIVGKQVFDITGSELDLGLLGLAEFVPTALLAPITGSLADRFDRRLVAAAGIGGEMIAALLLFSYARSDPTSVGPIFAIVALFGVARAVVAPPIRALPVDLAPIGLVERILALSSLTHQIGAIVGPVLAGFLYVVDPSLPYLVIVLLLVAAIGTLLLVPRTDVERSIGPESIRGAISDAFEGLRFIRRTPVLLGAISLDLFAVLFGGAVALLPAIADERLGVGAVGLGWLRAAIGIGAAITSALIAVRPVSRRVGPVLFAVVGLFGLATIVLGFTRSYVVAFVALLVLSASDAVSVFIRSTIVPVATPVAMRGRVLATEQVFIGASNELGGFESGVAAYFLGLVGAVVSGGLGTIVVVLIGWRVFPALSRVDRFDDIRPAKTPEP